MIKAIDKKYCKGNLVQLMHLSDACNFIVSTDEIILLKSNGNVLVNNYKNHQNRYEFPYSEKTTTGRYYNELFEYNKPYLNFRASFDGYGFGLDYFFKGTERALLYDASLPIDRRVASENVSELTREEIESIFNKDAYDSMYVIDVNGRILFANNRKNGLVIENNIIPSDEELISLDVKDRIHDQDMTKIARRIGHIDDPDYDESTDVYPSIEPRTIEEIKDLKLYGSALFDRYSHMLLTSKDGVFNLQWFKITFVEKNKFKMTYSNIPIIVPTIDDVISYTNNHDIEYTSDPIQRTTGTKVAEEQAIAEISDELSIGDESKVDENKTHTEGPVKRKRLRDIFKRQC